MGEDYTGRDQSTDRPETRRRMTVREAADELGITVEAVRGRIKRGTIPHGKAEDGGVYVWIQGAAPRDQTATGHQPDDDQSSDQSRPDDGPTELVEEMRERIEDLRDQLSEEREARRRADTIIMQLTQTNATLAARVPELEAAPSQEPPGAPESAAADAGGTQAPPANPSPQKATQPRSLWRRIFGG